MDDGITIAIAAIRESRADKTWGGGAVKPLNGADRTLTERT
jgi:hypothetical protein